MSMDPADEARARALLRIDQYGEQVRAAEPDPDPAALDAEGALAFAWSAPQVRASVYRFSGYAAASAAEDRLADGSDGSVRTWGTVNGPLMLWLIAAADDPATEELMEELVGNFAGEE